MVRDGNDIKTSLAEQIDRLSHFQRTVGKGSVNMKVTQKHWYIPYTPAVT
jgi:hypothetical protein